MPKNDPPRTFADNVTQKSLPPLAYWKAESFWYTMVSAVTSLLVMSGAVPEAGALTEPAVNTIMLLITAASSVLAWRERLNPSQRLALKGDRLPK